MELFPFDGGWRFGRDVVAYAVYAAHVVDYLVAHVGQKIVGEVGPVGCHGVGRRHGAQRHGLLVCAFVAHYAHALHRQQNNSGLPYLVIQTAVAQTLDKYMVGLLKYAHLLGRDVAENTHGQTRPGEGGDV